mmetsp:Transcript_11026/g.28230  ORF Transcript_11026/g.28230 Transcript_11026/m.28230 type:complete len:309 (-) Transcript_11026:513-1439(-)|eukprot:CAMPEP_0115860240 /NCGR_PEP_ID=MMETSP0287-20121206/17023_1 /TAXON_ID=412157 /ORGANISM="Chrysochromulina rotalis, Strain UIO044" /LENGTH=308 /DNA_ID=CAMNT_0003314553 /DNA_START=48 /DNA_END=974 /DNA_ORIENTATION=-
MAIALPAFLVENKRNHEPFPRWAEICFLGLYGVGQSGALVLPLVASWYGPTSIQLPVYQASMLMWNLVLMSALGMESFKKNQKVGTEVIVVATIMLIDAGPIADPAIDAAAYENIGTTMYTLVWLGVLTALWLFSLFGMVGDAMGSKYSPTFTMLIYVVAQGIGTSATTSLGKLLNLADGNAFYAVCALYGLAGATNTYSSVIAAQKLNQADFIPFASVCSLLLNQVGGLLLWEDWRTIKLWVSYTGIHVLIVLGIYDLSSAGSEIFEIVHQARTGFTSGRMKTIRDVGKGMAVLRMMKKGRGATEVL